MSKKALNKLQLYNGPLYSPDRVISLVSPSRSGSTIIKYALCLHPKLCCLAGEEEPYYKLAKNGYPWHASDMFDTVSSPELIRELITTELVNHYSKANRKVLQDYLIEEPPFVDSIQCNPTSTLVLKTPQNCYRRGVLEQLFPTAQIDYVVITRSMEATINGLLDGWITPNMFTSRKTADGWWKFDMPPGWSLQQRLLERCLWQYSESVDFIRSNYSDARLSIPFENFQQNWVATIQAAWDQLGLSYYTPKITELPWLSTTDPPEIDRWKIKRPWLEEALSYG